jgi:hypothetical protein
MGPRTGLCAAAAIALVPARAGAGGPVIMFCEDQMVGVEGGCAELHAALGGELVDFNLGVVLVPSFVEGPDEIGLVPVDVVERTREAGALFAVWFSRSSFEPGQLLTLHVYDPKIEQTISRTMTAFDGDGGLNASDVAFHTRIIMGASLYSDLEHIAGEPNLVALAVPEEKRAVIEEAAPEHRWARLELGYALVSYPTRAHFYHGIAFDAAVIPARRLEIFLDLTAAFLQDSVTASTDPWVQLENRHVILGLGARYAVVSAGRLEILPVAGFHLGISLTTVKMGRVERYTKLNPALWTGLEVRVRIARRVAVAAFLSFENVFRHERFFLENEVIFTLSQFRFGAGLMLSVGI